MLKFIQAAFNLHNMIFHQIFPFNTHWTKIVSYKHTSWIKALFQNKLVSFFHPTVWWESYHENVKRNKKSKDSLTVLILAHSTYMYLCCRCIIVYKFEKIWYRLNAPITQIWNLRKSSMRKAAIKFIKISTFQVAFT